MTYLGTIDDTLINKKAIWTAKEICQQPDMWGATQDILNVNASAISDFLEPIMAINNLRIILTGAGTSAYVGESLTPYLIQDSDKNIIDIATTDLVSGPHLYFKRKTPTLLVSFSRSGSSPESLAAVSLAEQMIDDCYQLIITCNDDGKLYKMSKTEQNCFALLMPPETHDKSFAMTSSFTSMVYAAFMMLSNHSDRSREIGKAAKQVIDTKNDMLKNLAKKSYWRVVYIGSNGFKGLAREAALKLLELTDGKIISVYESSLGFRHGPKSIITGNTLVFMFISNDPYTRKYDLDLLNELRKDNLAGKIVAISAHPDDELGTADNHIKIEGMENAKDAELLLPYITCAQIFAFHRALALGNTPDSPSSSGTVNRVVEGVKLYDYDDTLE